MTAEIAIMNKSAVALAADSAVTIDGGPGGVKIYQTNKLFMLSKYHPVGLMIFNNAEMMNLPWESIIKYFRQQLGDRHHDSLEEYGSEFITFLDGNLSLFPEEQQKKYFESTALSFLYAIRNSISQEVESIAHKGRRVSKTEIKAITVKQIKQHHDHLESSPLLPTIQQDFVEQTLRKYDSVLNAVIKQVYKKLPIPPSSNSLLKRFCANLFARDFQRSNYSGVVIAGFGSNDLYPSLVFYKVEGMVNNKLKYKLEDTTKIGKDSTASIVPFAQHEMVYTFIEGVDPLYQQTVHRYLHELFDKYPRQFVKLLPNLTAKQRKALVMKLQGIGRTIVGEFMNTMDKYSENKHVAPILEIVDFLPLSELASMAESLVNLTSFKRRFTMVPETVGGPIDVAVISKGDGFIWIKRKHYFEAASNPQFLANYYR
ncbi:MAG: hypothetical protein AABN34_04195 [Acidobacteriota bacterium]